ncbi:hypothetical protein TNCV_4082421 [Trichonephila clavipes]|nr:hypothetical protein TNCV_4082421 [Trichonephila clavipes]
MGSILRHLERAEAIAHFRLTICARGSLVVKAMDLWLASHEFQHCTSDNPPCRGAMLVEPVQSSNVLPLVW